MCTGHQSPETLETKPAASLEATAPHPSGKHRDFRETGRKPLSPDSRKIGILQKGSLAEMGHPIRLEKLPTFNAAGRCW